MGVILVILYVREKKRKKGGPNEGRPWGLTARWTSLAIHEEVVERGMKV